jgi:PIN domain nuclease of toxin-antitoxin system
MADLLLDTHAVLWLAAGERLAAEAKRALAEAVEDGRLLFSAVSAWELGLLTTKERLSTGRSIREWIADLFAAVPMLEPIPLEFSAAMAAGELPAPFHKDPADRLLVATARELDVPIVTRDRRILAYAAIGHVRAIAC